MSDAYSDTRLNINIPIYRMLNADIKTLTDNELADHYHCSGEQEGRPASGLCFTNLLLSSIQPTEDVLEIGPYLNPFIKGDQVKYLDILDGPGLVARAALLGIHHTPEPKIDYVSPIGDLGIVETNAFDVVISSHCLEHVPDLIQHFNEVQRILRPDGRYIIMLPDKRYCFDHYIAASTVADVIQAHHERRTTHSLSRFIESHALATHNDTKRHWANDHGVQKAVEDPNIVSAAIQSYLDANGAYEDLHAWRFTPRSFKTLLIQLIAAKQIGLSPGCVLGTLRDNNTFTAILRHID